MVEKEYIRKKHLVEGWSIHKISRQCQVSRQTVRKMLENADLPAYHQKKPRPCPVMARWKPVILAYLAEDAQPGTPHKQRHTATRIYARLQEEYPDAFRGAASTVRRCVRDLRHQHPEAFVPLAADAGELAEADFGKAVVWLDGRRTEVHLFVMRLRHSGVLFAQAFSTEKIEAFLEGHRQAFEWFGGVPRGVRYDNPKTAVTKILAGPARHEHALLSSLRAHYLFDSAFCRPGEPHEKGGVEHGVGYVRRNACVPLPRVEHVDALNAHLLAWCEKTRDPSGDTWPMERAALRPLPVYPHLCATVHPVVVSKLCLVHFDHNRYSAPSVYVGRTLHVRAYAEWIELLDRDRIVATHRRSHDRKQTRMELEHYLPVLARKPHAVTHAAVVRALPEVYQRIRERTLTSRPDGYKDFAAILQLHQRFPASAILQAIEEIGAAGVTAQQIEARVTAARTIAVPSALQTYRVLPPDPGRYDALMGR